MKGWSQLNALPKTSTSPRSSPTSSSWWTGGPRRREGARTGALGAPAVGLARGAERGPCGETCVGPPPAVDGHAAVKLGDGAARGLDEQEGEEGVDQARGGGREQARTEPDRDPHMLAIGLVDARRVVGEKRLQHERCSQVWAHT